MVFISKLEIDLQKGVVDVRYHNTCGRTAFISLLATFPLNNPETRSFVDIVSSEQISSKLLCFIC